MVLERAAGSEARESAEGLEDLVRRRLLRVAGDRFDFTHEQIRKVAYERLLLPRRRLLHRAVAKALEEVGAADLSPHYAALAFHYREGEAWPEALEYLRRAGASAAARGAYREAATCFEQACRALEHMPGAPEALELAVDLRSSKRWSWGRVSSRSDASSTRSEARSRRVARCPGGQASRAGPVVSVAWCPAQVSRGKRGYRG